MQKEVEGNKRITQCMGCMEIYEAFDDICPYCGYINGTMPWKKCTIQSLETVTLIKKYLVGRVLGFGGFGVTYIGGIRFFKERQPLKSIFQENVPQE